MGEEGEVDAAHSGAGALAASDRTCPKMSGYQGGGAGGVDTEGGAFEIEAEGNTTRCHAQRG